MHRPVFILLSIGAIFASVGSALAQSPNVEDLIAQLGADRFRDREAASKALWQRGLEVWPRLERATEHDDPEVALRADDIMKRLMRGEFHGLPPELAKNIEDFTKGNHYERFKLFPQIMKVDGPLGLFLLENMVPEADRSQLIKGASTSLRDVARELILTNQSERAESVLAMRSSERTYGSVADHAAFLHLLGRPPAEDRNVRAYQLAMNNETANALEACRDRSSLRNLQSTLLAKRGDWSTLAKHEEASYKTTEISGLGRRAAFHRLAGNPEAKDALADIFAYEKNHKADWFPVEALLLNDAFEEAVDLYLKQNAADAAQLAYDLSDYQAVLDLRDRLSETNATVEALARNILGPHKPWARQAAAPKPKPKKPEVFQDTLRTLLAEDLDKARLYALGDASAWHRAIYTLKPDDLPEGRLEEAHAWTERIGEVDNWGTMSSMRSHHFKMAMRDGDYDRAILCLERHRIPLHKTSFNYSSRKSYLNICFDSFAAQALRAAEAGEEKTVDRLLTHFAPLFGSHFGEHDATAYTKAGHPKLVAKILEHTYNHLQPKLAAFPACADLHNKFAWNVALSRTHLEEGLAASERSLTLRPKTPMYLDTKAELLFQLKRDEEAITAIQAAIALDPDYAYYQRQLKRFEEGKREDYPE